MLYGSKLKKRNKLVSSVSIAEAVTGVFWSSCSSMLLGKARELLPEDLLNVFSPADFGDALFLVLSAGVLLLLCLLTARPIAAIYH